MVKANIIIPIYKTEITSFEEISLKQLLTILGSKYSLSFICPKNLDVYAYNQVIDTFPNLEKINFERFPNEFFKGISGYNKLMLCPEFYARFLKYKYILIYQLDCYVFKDELDYWCRQGYDYIGAPWLAYRVYNLSKTQKLLFFINQYIARKKRAEVSDASIEYRVGNGGFSLRNPSKLHAILQKTDLHIIKKYSKNDSFSLYNEDVFWSYEVNKFKTQIKIPNYKKAVKFSLELNPEIGISMNNNNLPFGCHAWHKNLKFWGKYILQNE